MDEAGRRSLADSCGRLFKERPAAHSRRLLLLAVAGLAYPCAFALACLALCLLFALASFSKDSMLLAALSGLALGFLIRFAVLLRSASAPPAGLELSRKDAPALFMELDAVAQALGSKLPPKVLLDPSLNACCVYAPGVFRPLFAPSREFLVLGLPLMAALSPRLFRSVLAHELAHLQAGLPLSERLSRRAFQLWLRLEAFSRTPGVFLARPFLGLFASWYLPRLDALLSPARFGAEFSADATAASVAGRDATALALASVHLLSRRLESEAVQPFWDKARTLPEPPGRFVESSLKLLRSKALSREELEALFLEASSVRSLRGDSHPSFGERVGKLGFGGRLPDLSLVQTGADSAQTLLGDFESQAVLKLDDLWKRGSAPLWRSVYESSQAARAALSSMLNVKGKDLDSPEIKLQRARLLELAFGPASALRPLEDLVEEMPSSAEAKLLLGRAKLLADKPGGEALMLEACAERPELIHSAFDALAAFYRREGKADEFERLLDLRERAPQASSPEPKPAPPYIRLSDSISSPLLGDAERSALFDELQSHPALERAYLAFVTPKIRSGSEAAEPPFHALFVARKFSLLAYRGEDDSALASELSSSLSKRFNVKVLPVDRCGLLAKAKLRLLRNTLLYKS